MLRVSSARERVAPGGERSPFGERLGVSFRPRTPKPDAPKAAAVGLLRDPENGGESLGRRGLERAKGFEPSTPTLDDALVIATPNRLALEKLEFIFPISDC